jgi:transglutaminase/protease-like cytokinesis protein 3
VVAYTSTTVSTTPATAAATSNAVAIAVSADLTVTSTQDASTAANVAIPTNYQKRLGMSLLPLAEIYQIAFVEVPSTKCLTLTMAYFVLHCQGTSN